MDMQTDLFSGLKYPHVPAARNTDTSKAAAKEMVKPAQSIRAKVLNAITARGEYGATSIELSQSLHIPYEAVQPRTSELRKQQRIKDSGQRRASRADEKLAIVWVAL